MSRKKKKKKVIVGLYFNRLVDKSVQLHARDKQVGRKSTVGGRVREVW